MKTKKKGKMRQSYKGDEEKEGENVILKRIDLILKKPK